MAELSALPIDELQRLVVRLEQEMRLAATELRYEEAALLRDDIAELRLALAEAGDARRAPGPGLDGAGSSRADGVTRRPRRRRHRPGNRPLAPPVASLRWPTGW